MNCNFCEFRCDLSKGSGICMRYIEESDMVVEREPFLWTAPDLVPVETLPFFHALPDSMALRIGTKGCNASCDYCINSHLSIEDDTTRRMEFIPPEKLVERAIMQDARAIVFAMNEVTIFLLSAIAVADAAHRAGLMVGCLTNAFGTESTAGLLAEHMDFINVSLKSSRDDFYRHNLGLPTVQPVFRNIRIFAGSSHVEIVTPLAYEITTEVLHEIAAFIASVDHRMPWHLMRLFAAHKREDHQTYDFDSSIQFLTEIRKKLPFTYFGSFPGSNWVDTICPNCGEKVICRISIGACRMQFQSLRITDHGCAACGARIPLAKGGLHYGENHF
jgi:pyruvate formate lyase activating enzyme